MDKELERAYDALKQADEAGNKEDAQQIADYIRTLEAQQNVPAGKTSVQQVSDAELINTLTPTVGGAIAGEVIGPLVNKGVEAVQSGKAPTTTTAPAAKAAGTPFNPRGVTIEQSVQNWENYGQAQNEAAKRVRREAELHKKYPGFTRAQPPAPTTTPSAMSQLRQAIPGPVKTVGQFLGGAAQSGVVPWLGRAVAGGAAGYQGADAYNRLRQGDIVGGGLSAIGTLGAGASFFPHPAARYGGAAISAGAEGLNQYLDYLKKKAQQPAAAQPEQEQQMPVPMKEGGLVHLAGGKSVIADEALNLIKKTLQSGKSGKQLARESEYVHKITPTHKFSQPKKLSIQDLQNSVLVGVPGDRSLTGKMVHEVNAVPLTKPVEQFGGPLYGLQQSDLGNPNFWASQQGAASALQNKAAGAMQQYDKPVYGMYAAMAPDSSNYALHHLETLLNQVPAMNPAKSQIKEFDKMVRQQYPAFAGITDPDLMQQLKTDSKMRKFIADRMNKTTIADLYGLPSGEATLHAITEPALRNVATGTTGFSVGKLDPFAKLTPSKHPTYSTNIPGQYEGQMIAQLPWEVYFPDVAKKIAANPKQAKHSWGTFKMGEFNQPVTQEMVDRIAPIEEFILGKKEGGPVQNFDGGGKAGVLPKVARYSISQYKKVAEALEEYLKGNITKQQQMAITRQYLPIRQWDELPPYYTDEQVINALASPQRPKAFVPVPPGMQTGNRLDIRAYEKDPSVYVDTVHDAKGKPFSYNRTGHSRDVEFSSRPNTFYRVGLGTKEQALTPMGVERGLSKTPQAMMKGTNVGTSDEEVRRMMAEMLKDPNYTQIGMDPRVGSQFYDKATDRPIWTSGEKLQSGPLVIVPKKDIDTTSWEDPRLELTDFPGRHFKEGGSTTPAWQRSEGKSPSGGLNALGRASYKRETGGELKAPQPEGGSRKKSFCARMGGMKKKLTSSKTANDPDSRINKALRKWKC